MGIEPSRSDIAGSIDMTAHTAANHASSWRFLEKPWKNKLGRPLDHNPNPIFNPLPQFYLRYGQLKISSKKDLLLLWKMLKKRKVGSLRILYPSPSMPFNNCVMSIR